MNISDEAVEAAAKALDPQTMGSGGALAEKFKEQTRDEARRILEAAAPFMQARDRAEAWDEGRRSYRDDLAGTPRFGTPGYKETRNPYRSQA